MSPRSDAVAFVIITSLIMAVSGSPLQLITREEWHARPPKSIEPMPIMPVPYVIIHHSYIPPACSDLDGCCEAMREMQIMHQDQRGWVDIGYSFGAGGDGRAYVGRGWDRVGAHAPTYNNRSIGICVIGDWRVNLPPEQQLTAVKELIALGLSLGKIAPDYRLVTHRQVRAGTECPGDRLFNEVTTWPHFYDGPLERWFPDDLVKSAGVPGVNKEGGNEVDDGGHNDGDVKRA